MLRAHALLLGLSALAGAAACDRDRSDVSNYRIAGRTMGTSFSVEIVDAPRTSRRRDLEQSVLAALRDVDERMSTYRPESELSRINGSRSTDWIPISATLCDALTRANASRRGTGGAFDVTLGRVVDLWGFGPGEVVLEPPPEQDIARALAASGGDRLELDCARPALRRLHPELRIDLSAFAKGYAIDEVAELLLAEGVSNFLVEIGGELRTQGRNSRNADWTIAIEKPLSDDRAVHAVIELRGPAAVATSGDYRNFFDYAGTRYSHVIDPASGWPIAHEAASVTVIERTAAAADALATGLLVLGPDAGMALATSENVAACFLLREAQAFDELCSPRFEQLYALRKASRP